jgi:nucleotide-binding universal stress UspA family protein
MAPHPQLPDRPTEVHQDCPTTVVVVGVDDSGSSWDAFWWSCGEAKRLGGGIVAVFVSPPTGSGIAATAAGATALGATPVEIFWSQATTETAERLRLKISTYAMDGSVDFEFVHATGDPATELSRIAAARGADLIVVGKSCKVLHRLAGSLGRRLLKKRNGPVVVIVP